MKCKLFLSIFSGLFILSTCNGTPEISENSPQENAGENADNKRFAEGPSSFLPVSDGNKDIMDWSSAFKKRFGEGSAKNFAMNDLKNQQIVDWFSMLKAKRFNHLGGNFDSTNQDGNMIDWHTAFKKRGFQTPNDDDEQQLIDWSNMFKKRFGNPRETPESPNLVGWSLAFSKKKRSKRFAGLKRFPG